MRLFMPYYGVRADTFGTIVVRRLPGSQSSITLMKKIPGFHTFILRQVGDPKHVWRFARNWFVRPLSANSFSRFWYCWNPVYGYPLLFYVYRPLRRPLPRSCAVLLTFMVSGFFLHDLPF